MQHAPQGPTEDREGRECAECLPAVLQVEHLEPLGLPQHGFQLLHALASPAKTGFRFRAQ